MCVCVCVYTYNIYIYIHTYTYHMIWFLFEAYFRSVSIPNASKSSERRNVAETMQVLQ